MVTSKALVKGCPTIPVERAESEHPEIAYRRGFQQGAADALRAMQAGATLAEIGDWVYLRLYKWRLQQPHTASLYRPKPPCVAFRTNDVARGA